MKPSLSIFAILIFFSPFFLSVKSALSFDQVKFDKSLVTLTEYHQNANNFFEKNDFGLFLFLQKLNGLNEAQKFLENECLQSKNYLPIDGDELVRLLTKNIIGVEPVISEGKKNLADNPVIFYEVLNLSELFKKLALSICTEVTNPPYSKGNVMSFVKLDNQFLFMFGVGFPE
jgi:hypothetical protein